MRGVLAILVIGAGLSLGQISSTVSLSNGVEVRILTNLGQPTGQEVLKVEMAKASGDSFYRIFRDQNNLVVFAYELAVSRSASGNQFTFTAKPAEAEFAAKFPNADFGKPVPSLSSEHKLELRPGQDDDIGLFQIPGMGLSVTEKIQVTVNPDSANGLLSFIGLKVSINGGAAIGPARASVSGRYAMFYIPGRGGYFFATEGPTGRAFVKVGTIDGARLRFNVENTDYECTSAKPILQNAVSGEVWVYHDPAYKPEGNWTQEVDSGPYHAERFFAAASDSLSWWLP
jgi:hypothetical protein